MTDTTVHFNIEDLNGTRLIHVAGPLDSMTYEDFKKFLDPMVSRAHVRIVLDCRNLTYVNSRGLTLLMHYQRISKVGFSFFGIAELRPRIVKTIEMLGLDKLVKWYPTLDEAIQTAAAS